MWIRKPTPVTTESMVVGEAVQHQVEADVKVTDRHPGPQRLSERLLFIVEEINPGNGGHNRRQTYRAHPDGGGQVFLTQRP